MGKVFGGPLNGGAHFWNFTVYPVDEGGGGEGFKKQSGHISRHLNGAILRKL